MDYIQCSACGYVALPATEKEIKADVKKYRTFYKTCLSEMRNMGISKDLKDHAKVCPRCFHHEFTKFQHDTLNGAFFVRKIYFKE